MATVQLEEETRSSYVWKKSVVDGKTVKLYSVTRKFIDDLDSQKARIDHLQSECDALWERDDKMSTRLLSLEKPIVKGENHGVAGAQP